MCYQPLVSSLFEKGTVRLPSGIEEYGTDYELFLDVRAFVNTYVELDDGPFRSFAAAYILYTWLFDNFEVAPYLRALGDFESGKTTLLRVVGSVCYRPIFVVGATTVAAVFRILAHMRGTLILDEADYDRRSPIWAELVKVLNTGAHTGFPVIRAERTTEGGPFDVESYDTFGPKVLGSRHPFPDPALESRCLSYTTPIIPRLRDNIDLWADANFWTTALQMRNKLVSTASASTGHASADPRTATRV